MEKDLLFVRPLAVLARDATRIDKYRRDTARGLTGWTLKRRLSAFPTAVGIRCPRLPEETARDMVERALLRLVGLAGLAGVEGVFAARFAQVRPQYGCTLTPSLNFGFCLQCYGIPVR